MQPEPDSVTELEAGKFYHISFSAAPSEETLKSFQNALKEHGVRAIITLGEVRVSDLCVLFQGMTPQDRESIKKSLDYINPKEHEQIK